MASGLISARFVTSVFDLAKTPGDPRPAVAFAGRSNVGKSTLINGITEGKSIARVSGTPGKTQCLNFFLADESFYLVDLPGYGFAKVSKKIRESWGALVEGYLTADRHLRGLLFLIDCRRDFAEDDALLLDWVRARQMPFLIVMTKADKLTRNHLNEAVTSMRRAIFGNADSGDLIPFSSTAGLGKKEVLHWIRRAVK